MKKLDRGFTLTWLGHNTFKLSTAGGRVVLLGIAGQGADVTIPADRIPLRDLTVLGSVGYTTAAAPNFPPFAGPGGGQWDVILARVAADGSATSAKYNSTDPNKGHDHTFFVQHSRDVFAD